MSGTNPFRRKAQESRPDVGIASLSATTVDTAEARIPPLETGQYGNLALDFLTEASC